MKCTVEEVGPCKKKLSIEVAKDKVQETTNRTYDEIMKQIRLPGFRQGKVPRKVVEKRFGDKIEEDVKTTLLQETFSEVMEEKKIKPFGNPAFDKVEYKQGESLSFEAEVEIQPEFDLGDYKGLEVVKEVREVTDEDVEKAAEQFARRYGEMVPMDDSDVQDGDILVVEADYKVDGKSVHKDEDQRVYVGTDQLGPTRADGLGDVLKGKKVDEEAKLTVTLPDMFPAEDARGKEAEVDLKVLEIKRMELPDMDDAWVKEKLDLDSVADFKDEVRDSLENEAQFHAQQKMENDIIDQVNENHKFDLPEGAVSSHKEYLTRRHEMELAMSGLDKDNQAEHLKNFNDSVDEDARRQLKNFFILQKIADKEKIFVTENDMQEHIRGLAARQGVSPDQVAEQMRAQNQLSEVRMQLKERKAIAFMVEKAKVEEKTVSGDKADEKGDNAPKKKTKAKKKASTKKK